MALRREMWRITTALLDPTPAITALGEFTSNANNREIHDDVSKDFHGYCIEVFNSGTICFVVTSQQDEHRREIIGELRRHSER